MEKNWLGSSSSEKETSTVINHRLSESTLLCHCREVKLCVGCLEYAPAQEHSLLGICSRPSAPRSTSPASAARMHLGLATVHQGKWGALRDIPEAHNPTCPSRRDWGNIKRVRLGMLKEKHLQVCKRPLPGRDTSDLCFYSVKKQQHTLIIPRKIQAKHFRKNLPNPTDSEMLRFTGWQSSEAPIIINLMSQLDKHLSKTAWIWWVGLPSPFQPFPLISFDVHHVQGDLLDVESLQDRFSGYHGKAAPTNRQQDYSEYVWQGWKAPLRNRSLAVQIGSWFGSFFRLSPPLEWKASFLQGFCGITNEQKTPLHSLFIFNTVIHPSRYHSPQAQIALRISVPSSAEKVYHRMTENCVAAIVLVYINACQGKQGA